jgi:hypothetical protein
MLHQKIIQRNIYKTPLVAYDTFSPPRPVWSYIAGVWQAGTLRQTAPDVPAARAGYRILSRRDWEFEAEVKPTLVDASPRFFGLFAREFAGLTHYMTGVYYTSASARLRIYKQYAGLPKVFEGLATPTLDACFADSIILDSFTDMTVRGLSPRYSVALTYYDDSSERYTATATSMNVTVKKLVKKIDVYDAAGRLQGSNTQVSGGLDDFYLGGPGTYILLGDSPLTWDYSRARCWSRVRGNVVEVEFAGQSIYSVDTEFTLAGIHGLRAYESPSEWYLYRLRRCG